MPYVGLAVMVAVTLYIVGMYNGLVSLRNRVKNGWAQIDVQLKRRYDLIPNLVEVAKGYMVHEQQTLEKVTQARQQAVNLSGTTDVVEQARAENALSQTLRSLFAVAENYPELRANQNMLQLQEELTSTENRIAFARQHYNDEVMRLNTRIERFPESVVAGWLQVAREHFFEVEDSRHRDVPRVQF